MTTIAIKDEEMAVDRQASDGGLKYTTKQKSFRVGDRVFAIAGNLACGLKTVNWITGDRSDECPLDDDTVIIDFNLATGKVYVWEAPGWPVEHIDRLGAWGTGSNLAIGAMAAGADAYDAVEIAAAWDDGTGMGVDLWTMRD
jgi:hypothetical protein